MNLKIAPILTGSGMRVNFTLQDQDSAAVNITGATISVAVKGPTGTTLVTKTTGASTVTISSGSAGQFYIDLSTTDYSGVTAPADLVFVATVTVSGVPYVAQATLPIHPTDPNTYTLVSLADFKQFIGITDSASDGLLYRMLRVATQQIETWCNRTFASATYTEDFDGTGTEKYATRHAPITSITSLNTLSRDSDGVETATAISAGSYRYDSASGVVSLCGDGWAQQGWSGEDGPATFVVQSPRFEPGFKNYRIVYVAGYTTGTTPLDLQQACIDWAKHAYVNRAANAGMESESIGGGVSYTRRPDAEVASAIRDSVAGYRRWSL